MKAFIVTNMDNARSKAVAERHIEVMRRFGDFEVGLFEATLGHEADEKLSQLELQPLKAQYRTGELFDRMRNVKGGVKGCFVSHFRLWTHCVALGETIGVFEYDAIQVRKMPECSFDSLLYLSAFRNFSGTDADNYHEDLKPAGVHPYVGYNSWSLPDVMSGTHAYLIRPEAAQQAIEAAREYGWLAVDRFFSSRFMPFQKQTVTPAVFKVEDSLNLSAR